MPLDEVTNKELEGILALIGSDAFDAAAKRRLNNLLSGSEEARRIYLEHCQMQAMLQQSTLSMAFDAEKPRATTDAHEHSQRSWISWMGWAIAASVLFVFGLAAARFVGDVPGEAESMPASRIAYVQKLDGIAWSEESRLSQGANVSSGVVRLESGSMELRFDHGTRLLVRGPTQLSMDSPMQVSLVHGQVAAQVTENAHGFTVLGPNAAVVDLGTEFAMAVEDGESWVEVYDGEVEVALLDKNGHAWKSRELLTSDAVRIDASKGQIVNEASPIELPRLAEIPMEPLNVPAEYVESIRNGEPAHYWRFESADSDSISDTAGEAVAVLHGGTRVQNGGLYFPRGRRNHGFVVVDKPQRSLLNAEFTLEMWVNPAFTQRSTIIDINQREPESRLREKLYRLSLMPIHDQRVYSGQSVRFAGQLWPQGEMESVNVFSSTPYVPGVWHHVVAVRRNDQIEIYLNGNAVRSAPALPLTVDPLDATIVIGAFRRSQPAGAYSDQMFFKGMIDEVAVYPRALSGEEVAEHYRMMQLE